MKRNSVLEKPIVFHKVRNETGTSSAEAPYLGQVELAGVIPQETLVEEMIEDGCSATAATANLVLNAASAVVCDCVGGKGYKVHTGAALVMPHLTGSLSAPDAKPGEGNELVPRIDLGDDLRLSADDLTPQENREDISDLGGVRILSVYTEDVGFTQLKGMMPFSVAGVGFKPSAASSAAVKVVSAKTGVETEAVEVTVVDNQHITAHLGEVLPKGSYKVVVVVTDESAAGNRDASYNVKMLPAPQPPAPPEPIAVSSDGAVKVYAVADDAGASTPDGLLSAHGTLFVRGTGVTLQAGPAEPGLAEDVECDLVPGHGMRPGISIEQTADGISVAFGSESGMMKNGEYPDAKLVLRYYKPGEMSSPELIEVPVGIKVTEGQEDWPE